MTHVYNDPADFKDDMLRGFAAAHRSRVERVDGASGFVRAGGPLQGKVSLVIGGGSGHYPSYCGVVGPGFADGAVLGDIFASPSAEQVYRIARAAHGGAGVLLSFGNYAGDRLNFADAAERLREEGIDVRIVFITDDIASADAEEREKRRGIAGTFSVYKMAGAAAERGADLDEVERLTLAANAATFSFGVAFDGCTLPGAEEPLFHVERGKMDFGLGIHGEPGISTTERMPAAELAQQLVASVLAERPQHADGRAAVVLNGLGATKSEELFVLYADVAHLLETADVTPVMPEVGELVTSLDMAGCSLSLTWLDDELESLWTAPADTPAFRRGESPRSALFTKRHVTRPEEVNAESAEASEASLNAAMVARAAVEAIRATMEQHKDYLGEIDAVAGDGDHGIGMSRGSRAAAEAAAITGGGVQSVLVAAGSAFADKAGGTSGILWGKLLGNLGLELGNEEEVTAERLADAVRVAAERLQSFGKAELGDKTMLDSLFPFVEALRSEVGDGTVLATAWRRAAVRCVEAAEATAPLVPRIGRARPLAERSVGTPDPGAVSLGLIVTAIADVLAATRTQEPQEEGTS